MVQVELRSGTTRLVTWVDRRVKPGDQVILKVDKDRRWDVLWVGTQTNEFPNRGWHVGGL